MTNMLKTYWLSVLLLLKTASVEGNIKVTHNRSQLAETNPTEYESQETTGKYEYGHFKNDAEDRLLTGKYKELVDATTKILPQNEESSAFLSGTTERISMTEEYDRYSGNGTAKAGKLSTEEYEKSMDVSTKRTPLTEEYNRYSVNITSEERQITTKEYEKSIDVSTKRTPLTEEYDRYSVNVTSEERQITTEEYEKSMDVTTKKTPLTEEYDRYSVNITTEERLITTEDNKNMTDYDTETRLPTEEYERDTEGKTAEAVNEECKCPYTGPCTSNSLGKTYKIKDILSSTVNSIVPTIEYVDNLICREEENYRRVALETAEELHFLVDCMLCNSKTQFGNSLQKWNIMTAGLVEVTRPGLWVGDVPWMNATWKIWNEIVDMSVPDDVVLLDRVTGTPVGPIEDLYHLLDGYYSIFLVGNSLLRCNENDKNYLQWGLMSHASHSAVSLENLVGYTVCESMDVASSTLTGTTNTNAATASSSTAPTADTYPGSILTTSPSSTSPSTPAAPSRTPPPTTSTPSSTTPPSTTSTPSSTTPPSTTSTPSSTTPPDTTSAPSSTTPPSTTSTPSSTTPLSTTSAPSSTTPPDTTSTPSSTTPPSTTSTPSSTSPSTTTSTSTTSSSTTTEPTTTSSSTTRETSTTSASTTSETSTSSSTTPYTTNPTTTTATTSTTTTTTTSTTTTTTTTTSTTTTTTPTVPAKDCCNLPSGGLLCPGSTQSESCPSGYSGFHRVTCEQGEIKDEDHCLADWINDVIIIIDAGNSSAVDIADVVQNMTDKNSNVTSNDLTNLVFIVNNMTSLLEQELANSTDSDAHAKQEMVQDYTTKLVKIEGNLFTYEAAWDGLSKENSSQLGSSLLHDLEKTGFILAGQAQNATLNFTDPVLNLTVLSKPRNELAGIELYFPGRSNDTFIRLPEDFEAELEGTQGRVVSYFLDQGAASHALPAALNDLSNKNDPKEINGLLVSMTLDSLNHSVSFQEGNQVSLRIKHTYRESGPYYRDLYRDQREGEVPSRIPGSAACVYWDPNASAWVNNGCVLVSSNRDVTYCNCSHLSMFSVITDVHRYMGRDFALDVLGTVLSSLSCIFLLFAICILQFCKGVQSSPRISITKQLCISLFLSHLFLIFFLDRDFLKLSDVGCEAVAGMLHYLLTASICWMLVEGLQLFHTVHFTLNPTSFMVVFWVIGYGVPAVVVLVTLLVAFGSSQWNRQEAYGDSEYCWLTAEGGYIWAFTGPLVAVIVANAIFMVCALRSAAILRANKKKSLQHRVMLYIKGSFSLNCVLGVTWVFGLLYINSNHFFAYVFTILNASQGLMIFAFNCVLNENVWTAFVSSLPATLRRRLMKGASDKGLTSGRVTSGDCSTFKKPTNSPAHYHNNLQPPPRRPSTTHQAMQLNNSHLTPYGHHHHHHHHHHHRNPVSRRSSQTDSTELDSSRHQFSLAGDPRDSAASSRSHDRSQREAEKRHDPSFTADVLSEALTAVASSPHRPPRRSARLPQEAVRRGSVPARVLPPDHRVYNRKASQWSADTQISFISDGKSSRKSSLDSSYIDGYSFSSPSSSASSSPSISSSSNILSSLEQTLRIYPSHRDPDSPALASSDDVQRCIHTIPECEERSPSCEKTFHFS